MTTVVGATGERERVVEWTKQAWLEIALLHQEWRWLRRDVSFVTTTGQLAYLPGSAPMSLTDFAAWRQGDEVWRRYRTGEPVSENYMQFLCYEDFRTYWLFGSRRTEQGEPLSISVRPYDNALLLGPLPNATGYTIVGEYYAAPTELSVDADTPAMPSRFHMAIVYRAMQKYGAYESATEVYTHGQTEYNRMLTNLETDQLYGICGAGPLA